jgi:hypothetical protein
VIVVPLSTSKAQARCGLTAVEIPADAGELARCGVSVCQQATTLDRSKPTRYRGRGLIRDVKAKRNKAGGQWLDNRFHNFERFSLLMQITDWQKAIGEEPKTLAWTATIDQASVGVL